MAKKKTAVTVLAIIVLSVSFVCIWYFHNTWDHSGNDTAPYSMRVGETDDTHWWNNTGEILQISPSEESIVLRVINSNEYIVSDTDRKSVV